MAVLKSKFTKAQRYTYFNTSHTTTYDGSETKHVKSNLTASVDGNYTVKADAIYFQNPVVFQSTASLDGNIALGGNLSVTGDFYVGGSMIITSSVLHMGDNIFGDQDADNHKFFGTTTASGGVFISGSLIGQANASIDGNLALGGNLSVTGKNVVTSSIIGQTNASLDGTLAVGGNTTLGGQLDMGQNKIVNVENVVRSVKKTIAYSDFTATSRKFPQNITIFRASPGDSVIGTTWNLSANFAVASLMGTGLKAVRRTLLAIGDLGATGGFRRTTALATDTGWNMNENTSVYSGLYLQSVHASPLRKNYTAATLVKANFRASAAMLASLDQGSVDIYIDVLSRS